MVGQEGWAAAGTSLIPFRFNSVPAKWKNGNPQAKVYVQ